MIQGSTERGREGYESTEKVGEIKKITRQKKIKAEKILLINGVASEKRSIESMSSFSQKLWYIALYIDSKII